MQNPHRASNAPTRRKNIAVACSTCRSRRSKCSGQRPVCAFCGARGLDCHYEQIPPPPPSNVDLQLAAINRRLDHITGLLYQSPASHPQRTDQEEINKRDNTPFKLLGTQSVMVALGLDANFSRELRRLERSVPHTSAATSSRLYLFTHQQALTALAAFSTHVHIWYPILHPGFSEHYFDLISGPLTPSSESCVTLMVTAIGLVAHDSAAVEGPQHEPSHGPYFEAAMACLPTVFAEESVASVQSLILLSIYYCCLSRPCHAHDYCLVASFKIQNLLKGVNEDDRETYERLKRAYWVVLLLESELNVQFDVADSGIWSLDNQVALPDNRGTWQFDIDVRSPVTASTSPASALSTSSPSTDKAQSYFLAEISMRRMLHRCNTAIRKTAEGQVTYVPAIALELELQLDEWYNYLPDVIRFQVDFDEPPHSLRMASSTISPLASSPLSNFLRVQYHCCRISIYWPAVYQAIHDGSVTDELQDHCRRFFNSYIQLMPSILPAFHECIVNRWTLFASIFMTTLAAMKGAASNCLESSIDSAKLRQCFALARDADRSMVEKSPSLTLLAETLEQKLATVCSSPPILYDADG